MLLPMIFFFFFFFLLGNDFFFWFLGGSVMSASPQPCERLRIKRATRRFSQTRSLQQEAGTPRSLHQDQEAYVRIVEQPKENSLRFRYECEGRSAGSLQGVSSTSANKTYPSIEIVNQAGPVVVVASCVTVEGPPYRTHPHNLVCTDPFIIEHTPTIYVITTITTLP